MNGDKGEVQKRLHPMMTREATEQTRKYQPLSPMSAEVSYELDTRIELRAEICLAKSHLRCKNALLQCKSRTPSHQTKLRKK